MQITLKKPIIGTYEDIKKAPDDVFSNGLMGGGFIVKPTHHDIISPITGVVKMIYPTHHAFAISNDDVDIMIHVGLNETLRSQDCYELSIQVGDHVTIGDLISKLNIDFDKQKELDYLTPIIFVQKNNVTLLDETNDTLTVSIDD